MPLPYNGGLLACKPLDTTLVASSKLGPLALTPLTSMSTSSSCAWPSSSKFRKERASSTTTPRRDSSADQVPCVRGLSPQNQSTTGTSVGKQVFQEMRKDWNLGANATEYMMLKVIAVEGVVCIRMAESKRVMAQQHPLAHLE
eukprot:scaffold48983_cov17-Tisochrysis_lutea.AAC.6